MSLRCEICMNSQLQSSLRLAFAHLQFTSGQAVAYVTVLCFTRTVMCPSQKNAVEQFRQQALNHEHVSTDVN